jgi:hypothetical protein
LFVWVTNGVILPRDIAVGVIEDIVNTRTGILHRGAADGNMPVQGLAISSITPTAMCYLFYYTEKNPLGQQSLPERKYRSSLPNYSYFDHIHKNSIMYIDKNKRQTDSQTRK